jgi:NADPH:quinone reductase-like Zn-dependent oxidoreductase
VDRCAGRSISPHRTLPLENVAEAQRMLEERSSFGKIVIDTTK